MAYRRNVIYLFIVLSALTGFISGRAFYYKVSYGFGALLAVSLVYSWLSVNWLQLRRQTFVRRTQVGQYFEETFWVTNRSIIPKLWLEVHDHSTLPDHRGSQVVPMLNYDRAYRWDVQTLCTRRGQFTLGPITITSGDPFGLYQFPRHIATTSTVIVYPQTFPIYDFATPIGALSGGQAVRRLSFEVTPHAAGVREYAPGDSFKRIHWRTSAKRSKLYVKEFEIDPLGDVWIFLDLSQDSLVERPSMHGPAPTSGLIRLPPSTEEYGIAAAASLAQYFIEKSRTVGFLCYTPYRRYIAPDRGDRQLTDILEVLATARSKTDMSLRQMLALESQYIPRGSTVILVTAALDSDWIAEAHVQARRGIMVLVVLLDPTSFGATTEVRFEEIKQQTEMAGVYVYPLRQGDDITQALSYEANGNS
jgi:uncharacterized protein (DUF58 family)